MSDATGCENDAFGELGVLYGRALIGRLGHATVAAEAAFRPLPVVGFGIQAFANLNLEATYGGLVAFLQVGWLP